MSDDGELLVPLAERSFSQRLVDRLFAGLRGLAEPAKVLLVLVAVALWCSLGWRGLELFFLPGLLAILATMCSFLVLAVLYLGAGRTVAWGACLMFASPFAIVLLFIEDAHPAILGTDAFFNALFLALGIVLAVVFCRRGPRQGGAILLGLGAGMLGLLLSYWNLASVVEAPIDRSATELEHEIVDQQRLVAEAEQAAKERAELTGGALFAEQTDADRWNLEGMSEADAEAFLRKQAEAKAAKERIQELEQKLGPAWKRNAQEREVAVDPDADGPAVEGVGDDAYADLGSTVADEQTEKLNDEFRYPSAATAYVAKRSSIIALLFARMMAFAAIFMALAHWLRQLNWTFPVFPVLPCTGRLLDQFEPKERTLWWQTRDPRVLAGFLRTTVARGESFICFVPEPVLGVVRLRRWLPRFLGGGIRHLNDVDPGFVPNADFVFDGAWYGRTCFSITEADQARAYLLDLQAELDLRADSDARARRTMNILWAMPEPLPVGLVKHLSHQVTDRNLRLIICSEDLPDETVASYLDAVYDAEFFA